MRVRVPSCVIDAIEGRYVATADVPGAFLQTEMPEDEEDVHIRLEGAMAELLAKIDPELYNSCMVTTKRGRKIIYAKAEKAIYGTLKAALLFWVKISGKLEEWGFDRNPYDMCTMNKLENNGKASSTKRTRHINIRYFTITDRVKNGEDIIEYCPTGDMIADFFTKPLQGSLFRKFRTSSWG